MLGVDSTASPATAPLDPRELAERCRDVRERLLALAEQLASLRREIDDVLTSTNDTTEPA